MRKTIMLVTLVSASYATTITNPPDIILWDLHDVILQCCNTFQAFCDYEHKKELVTQTSFGLLKKLMSCLLKNMYYETSVEEYISLAKEYDNPYLAELIIRLCNAQKPISGTVEIIDELYSLGYQQHIGSNIGQTPFEQLIDPSIHSHFKEIFSRFNLEKSKVVDARNITKPNPQFFEEYLRKNGINLSKSLVVFIDDRQENIDSARELGFTTILFQNPNQLRAALQELEIPLLSTSTDSPPNQNDYELYG